MKKFEMAHSDDSEEIILATQRSLLTSMQDVITGLEKDLKVPGLTWEQIHYFLEGFKNKRPEIITQTDEM